MVNNPFLPYITSIPRFPVDAQALVRFAAHIQQVDMESNGKRVSIDGATLTYECGVSHSTALSCHSMS